MQGSTNLLKLSRLPKKKKKISLAGVIADLRNVGELKWNWFSLTDNEAAYVSVTREGTNVPRTSTNLILTDISRSWNMTVTRPTAGFHNPAYPVYGLSRVGDEVLEVRLDINIYLFKPPLTFNIYPQPLYQNSLVRILIVRENHRTRTNFGSNDYPQLQEILCEYPYFPLNNYNTRGMFHSHLRPDRRARFTMLYDTVHELKSSITSKADIGSSLFCVGQAEKFISISLDIDRKINYLIGNPDEPFPGGRMETQYQTGNGIYMYAIASHPGLQDQPDGDVQLRASSVFWFRDI